MSGQATAIYTPSGYPMSFTDVEAWNNFWGMTRTEFWLSWFDYLWSNNQQRFFGGIDCIEVPLRNDRNDFCKYNWSEFIQPIIVFGVSTVVIILFILSTLLTISYKFLYEQGDGPATTIINNRTANAAGGTNY